MDHQEKQIDYLAMAQEVFTKDAYATETTGIVIEAAQPGYSRCRLTIDRRHLNGVGAVMGGVFFTLADFAFAIASNIVEVNTQTLSSQITYLSTAKGDTLIAEARRVKEGRSTCYYIIDITDNTGRLTASVATTGFITRA